MLRLPFVADAVALVVRDDALAADVYVVVFAKVLRLFVWMFWVYPLIANITC